MGMQMPPVEPAIVEAHGTGIEVFADGLSIREKTRTTEFLFWRMYDGNQPVEVARIVMLKEEGRH